jgi:hypothetical protein
MDIIETQKKIQEEVVKQFLKVNYNPSWISRSLDGYFKKGDKK